MTPPRHTTTWRRRDAALADAMAAHAVAWEPGYALFGSYEDVPHAIAELPGACGTCDVWCLTCATRTLDAWRATGWDGLDTRGWPVRPSLEQDGEGPASCAQCGVALAIGMTWYSIEVVLDLWETAPLTPACVPEVCEGWQFLGPCPPQTATERQLTRRFRGLVRRVLRALAPPQGVDHG